MSRYFKRFFSGLWHHKYIWTLLIFIVLVGFIDPNSFWVRNELRKQNNKLREEIANYEEKFRRDSKELEELEYNPEAVERVARVKLYMRTADEDVYVIE